MDVKRTVAGLIAAGVSLAGTTFTLPIAHADQTRSVKDICTELQPGSYPISFGFLSSDVTCVVQGPSNYTHVTPGEGLKSVMPRIHPGSYQVEPANPWSDWVIP